MAPPFARAIASFRQDELGDWVAVLACGHTQHTRHRPPLESRPWVLSEEGRREHLGATLPCTLCLMPVLPAGLVEYKRTAIFDAKSVPSGLTKSHRLKPDVWGEIVVTAGHLIYELEDIADARFVLRPELSGVVAPEQPHHVTVATDGAFYVRFLRAAEGAPSEGEH